MLQWNPELSGTNPGLQRFPPRTCLRCLLDVSGASDRSSRQSEGRANVSSGKIGQLAGCTAGCVILLPKSRRRRLPPLPPWRPAVLASPKAMHADCDTFCIASAICVVSGGKHAVGRRALRRDHSLHSRRGTQRGSPAAKTPRR